MSKVYEHELLHCIHVCVCYREGMPNGAVDDDDLYEVPMGQELSG